jgi:hypothetical protein
MVEETYTIGMALYDFVPVIGFLFGGIYLIKICAKELRKPFWFLMVGGVILIVLGGGFQATWKLLCAANLTEICWMHDGQFVFMAFGYTAMLIPTIALVWKNRLSKKQVLPAMAVWKLPFLMVMTLSSLATYGLLTTLSFRLKRWVAGLGFVIAILSVLSMGYLASQTQTIQLQWIEQSINTVGNWGFALGAFLLNRAYQSKEKVGSE